MSKIHSEEKGVGALKGVVEDVRIAKDELIFLICQKSNKESGTCKGTKRVLAKKKLEKNQENVWFYVLFQYIKEICFLRGGRH